MPQAFKCIASVVTLALLVGVRALAAPPIELTGSGMKWDSPSSAVRVSPENPAWLELTAKRSTAEGTGAWVAVDPAVVKGAAWKLRLTLRSDAPATVKVWVLQTLPHLANPVSRTSLISIGESDQQIELPFHAPSDLGKISVVVNVQAAQVGTVLTFKQPQLLAVSAEQEPRAVDTDFERALARVKAEAWRSERVAWPGVETLAHQLLGNPATPESRRNALTFVLHALADGHSFVYRSQPPSAAAPASAASTQGMSPPADFQREAFDAGYYLKPAPIASMDAAEGRRYASSLAGAITSAPAATCGWVVDLRRNPGGNMYPALNGLWQLFGDKPLGQFLSSKGNSGWGYSAGSSSKQEAVSAGPARFAKAPVAVLIDKSSASAAEALAISFIGRDHTRLFGNRSGGYTTANQVIAINEQLQFALAVAMLADLSGKIYPLGIAPDVKVEASSAEGQDPARQQAEVWVAQQCTATK